MNKARHDIETKMTDQIEKSRILKEIIIEKDEIIALNKKEYKAIDIQCVDLNRQLEQLGTEKETVEKHSTSFRNQL